MKIPIDTNLIHEISQLDSIRQKAHNANNAEDGLKAAASQFEALFTQMLFKSMRKANKAFESNLMSSQTTNFYQQLADEQLASNLSREGSLGLTKLIVEQFRELHQNNAKS